MQFFYSKDEAQFESAKTINTKFLILQPNLTGRNQYLIYDNNKVIIFHLLNFISPLVPKLHDKIKQKLALLFSCNMIDSRVTLI